MYKRQVVAGVEIVETCRLVVNSAAIADFVIEIILTLLGSFTVVGAVSYTHLDVYKRQSAYSRDKHRGYDQYKLHYHKHDKN